ncbi:glycosyltransferase [Magnetospirillum sp. UT-4]|uniref:glycosyltransferase n=1 Tax=Magnetospirillum sp. UT-4 TaxID=2681467 RepID=UPI00137E9A37|nr:glycosyltransferase [Magnetospirillum sp. UT-4]CAA7619905.1 Glycosyltransferase [Magnetospirillum sp. UT-4]
MRILQAMAGAEHGGAEAFFERLAVALQRAGVEQQVLIRDNPRRAQHLRAGGVAVTELPFGGLLDLRTRFGFRRAVEGFRPDIVLTWMNRASRFCPPGPFVQVGRLGGYYDLKYYRRCRHLIGNTTDICEWIVGQGWDPARVHYVPNFVAEENVEAAHRDTFSTPPHAPLIVALGRLHRNKAFDVLIKAVAAVPDVYLWIAGEGPLRGELEALASHLGAISRVRFLGWRDDVAALYAAADLFVCPSRHEPLGNVVIEAWAQGVPVVAAASQGPTQLITDGIDGILVPVDDAAAMGLAIRRVLFERGLAENLGAAGRRAYEDRFTEQAVVARYLEFFHKVAG